MQSDFIILKNLLTVLFCFLLLGPKGQAHTDVIVFNDVIESHTDIEKSHEREQHDNDSDDEKNTEHHHHCNSISLTNVFLLNENQLSFIVFPQLKERFNYDEENNYFSYLDSVFQPPKNS